MNVHFAQHRFHMCGGKQFVLFVVIKHFFWIDIFPSSFFAPLTKSLHDSVCRAILLLIEILTLEENALIDRISLNC